jgi:hypothetical protein
VTLAPPDYTSEVLLCALRGEASAQRTAGRLAYREGLWTRDNPHPPGSVEHRQWDLGIGDGIMES